MINVNIRRQLFFLLMILFVLFLAAATAGILLFIHVQAHTDDIFQNVGVHNLRQTVRSLNPFANFRHTLTHFHVDVIFVLQAAHETSADSGYFGRIQRQILHLGHLDGYRLKICQPAVAAQRTSASADAAHHLGFVTDTNLTQFNTHLKHTCQILYQFTEVYTAVCSKVENNLAVIKGVFHVNQLHNQTMLVDFFLAKLQRPFFLLYVFLMFFIIFRRSDTDDFFQRCHNFTFVHFLNIIGNGTILHAACGFHDDIVAVLYIERIGIKIIYFSCCFKSYTSNFYHISLQFLSINFSWHNCDSLSSPGLCGPLR